MARLDTSSLTRTVNEHLEALNNSGPDKIETTRLKALSEARLLVDSLITPMEKLSQSMFQVD